MKKSTWAFDYDNTFTTNPAVVASIMKTLQHAGITVIVLTGRSNEGQWGEEVRTAVAKHWPSPMEDMPAIVFAGRMWKRAAATLAGYAVDVFVDDSPEYIGPQSLIYRGPDGEMEDRPAKVETADVVRHKVGRMTWFEIVTEEQMI